MIVDPGSSFRHISATLANPGQPEVKAIILTHGHFDHIGAVDKLVKLYGCPVYACRQDQDIMTDPALNQFADATATIHSPLSWIEESPLVIGSMTFTVYFTPGHTPGSVMFEIENNLFTGDTLFCGDVGRTDLYRGSETQLNQSLKMIRNLNPDLVIWPGHGDSSTLWQQLKTNPYLQ